MGNANVGKYAEGNRICALRGVDPFFVSVGNWLLAPPRPLFAGEFTFVKNQEEQAERTGSSLSQKGEEVMSYTTQMDAARRGIVTPELETVARKEHMSVEELMPLVAAGKVAIPANRLHKCLDPEGIVEFRNLLLRLNQERQTTILISSHILSELANLATCYGFLDNGMMLEQISARALEEKCRACIEARVDDASRAALVLEQSLGIRDYEVLPGHLLRIYSSLDAPHRVAQALVEGGVALQSIESRGANLEDYFLSMIGGVRHA